MSATHPTGPPSARPDVFSQSLGDSPWTAGDLRRALVYLTAGLLGIVVAWIGASGTTIWRDQLVWTAVGVAAAVIGAASGATWLLAGLARVRTGRSDLKAHFRDLGKMPVYAPSPQSPVRNGSAAFVWSPGMTRFHRPDCDLVRGKSVQMLTRVECNERHLEACGMCQP